MKLSLWERIKTIFRGRKSPGRVTTPQKPESFRQTLPEIPVGELVVASGPTVRAFGGLPLAELVIGLDFGTSCTKVVIGDPGWQGKFYAVPFGNASEELSTWLHPTRLRGEANLKMRLMDAPGDMMVQNLIACYLAEVIRHCCQWFGKNAPARYEHARKTWKLNLGFPGKSTGTGSELEQAYRTCAELAVQLASLQGAPTPADAERLRSEPKKTEAIAEPSPIELYPEIAAQLTGYIKSPFAHHGPLLLVDVGAGTLDVSTLIIHGQQHTDNISFFMCDVQPLGTLRLHQARTNAMNEAMTGCVRSQLMELQDGLTAIPERWDQMTNARSEEAEPCRIAFDTISQSWISQSIGAALPCLTRFRQHLRDTHDAVDYDPWPGHLRLFLTGGGSRCSLFKKCFAAGRLEREMLPFTHWHYDYHQRHEAGQGLKLEAIPCPNNLQWPDELHDHFDRLSVAYGLAQGTLDLAQVRHIQQ